jgi:DNA replication initiation complex subunit (GINS family)
MNWKGPIKPVYLDLPEDLHLKVKSEAPLRKTTARAAYQEAVERWLFPEQADRKDSESEEKSHLTREEKALVDKLVALLRDPANPVAAPVKLMLEQYKPPKPERDHEKAREEGAQHRRKLRAG